VVTFDFAKRSGPRKVLCLGAHCDDIEIGCGGTILRWLAEQPAMEFYWVVFSSDRERKKEALSSSEAFLNGARKKKVCVEDFRNGFFPYIATDIKDYFEDIKQRFSPDIVLTHCRDDRHQDHRLLSDLTWNTFRQHTILEYEIPKYDGDLGQPNLFVHLNHDICVRKIGTILSIFKSQADKHWFTEDAFRAILRLRGVESAAPEKYAEAFYCRKMAL
jgi:LmbE family N-acetylglucosaminyl deacetylase